MLKSIGRRGFVIGKLICGVKMPKLVDHGPLIFSPEIPCQTYFWGHKWGGVLVVSDIHREKNFFEIVSLCFKENTRSNLQQHLLLYDV